MTAAIVPPAVSGWVQRIRMALRRHPLPAYLGGMWLRRHFTRAAGAVVWVEGFPAPRIRNLGVLVTQGCTLSAGTLLEVAPGARLALGKGVFLNRGVRITCESAITIGQRSVVGWDTVILDTDQHERAGMGDPLGPVVIEEDVWLGCRVIVLKGVTIGRGAVVAAGSVVVSDVPPDTLVAGQPARVIRTLPRGIPRRSLSGGRGR